MNAQETRILKGVVKYLRLQAEKAQKTWKKEWDNAGHDEPGGTGDEGWMRCHNLGGKSRAYFESAELLNDVLRKLGKKKKTK